MLVTIPIIFNNLKSVGKKIINFVNVFDVDVWKLNRVNESF